MLIMGHDELDSRKRLILKAKPDFDSPVVGGAVAEDKPQEEAEDVKDKVKEVNSAVDKNTAAGL